MAQNDSLLEKVFRFSGALLLGGAIEVGREAIKDYKSHQKEQSWEDEMLSRMEDAFEKDDYAGVVKIADLIIDEEDMDKEVRRIAVWYKAKSCLLCALDEDDEQSRKEALNKAEDLFYDYGNEFGWDEDVVYMLMIVYECSGLAIASRNAAICLMDSDDRDVRTKALNIFNETTDVLLEHRFTEELSYSKRKYIFIGQNAQKIGGTYQWYDDQRVIDWIFTLDQLPSDIVFPTLGRPQPGLYMAHPIMTDHYYPMKGVEETLFMEKVREFCWLVQCLGAREVSYHSDKGLSVSQGMGSSMNIDAQVGVKGVNVGGEYGNTRKRDDAYTSNQQVELVQNFTPKKRAYCPDDLIWLDSDPAWQMLIKQRLEGELMEYTYKISSSETCQMSTNEMDSVKANFEYMMVKVNGSFDITRDQTFNNNEETEWSIYVEFAPIEELTEELNKTESYNNQNKTTMNDYEKMDGGMSLTEQERKDYGARVNSPFSMKIRDVWELEKYPQYPMALGRVWSGTISKDTQVVIVDDDNKYEASVFGIGMFGKILEEAEAGDACGIMLQDIDVDNLQEGAVIYKLSEYSDSDKQTCITDSEQEYLDMVRECFEDGEIGNRERKLLDKIRVKNGISEERAKELESTLIARQLTDDEKEYLEAFKDACEDGKLSEKHRRLLEKLRVMYGISEERARAIEKIK